MASLVDKTNCDTLGVLDSRKYSVNSYDALLVLILVDLNYNLALCVCTCSGEGSSLVVDSEIARHLLVGVAPYLQTTDRVLVGSLVAIRNLVLNSTCKVVQCNHTILCCITSHWQCVVVNILQTTALVSREVDGLSIYISLSRVECRIRGLQCYREEELSHGLLLVEGCLSRCCAIDSDLVVSLPINLACAVYEVAKVGFGICDTY